MAINYFSFDGSTSALDCGSQTLVGDFTIAARVKPTAYSATAAVFKALDVGSSTGIALLAEYPAAGNLSWQYEVNGTGTVSGSLGTDTTLMPTGSDAFVVIVRSGTTLKLYINGVLIDTETTGAGSASLAHIRLGCQWNGTSNTAFFDGEFAQFGIWSIAWSGGDISAHAAGHDPTSIEWAHILQYQPLQQFNNDLFGAPINDIGSPGIVGTAQTISVAPTSVVQSSTTTLTLAGTGTAWATGIAAPMVTAGMVASDVIGTATSQTFSFTAPGSGSSVTITDPTTGAQVALALTVPAGNLALTGPTSGVTLAASTNFTVTASSLGGSDTVTPAASGGTVTPTSLSFSSGSSVRTFTATPASNGVHSISITDTLGAVVSGSPISYTSTEPGTLALSGPASGATGTASTAFTIVGTGLSSTDTVTCHTDSGGTFTTSPLTFASGTHTQTFTYTPGADGRHLISITDSLGAAISGSPIAYTSPTPIRKRGGSSKARRAAWIAGIPDAVRPNRSPVIGSTPPPPRPAKAANPAPPERPAVSDARPRQGLLDLPVNPIRVR